MKLSIGPTPRQLEPATVDDLPPAAKAILAAREARTTDEQPISGPRKRSPGEPFTVYAGRGFKLAKANGGWRVKFDDDRKPNEVEKDALRNLGFRFNAADKAWNAPDNMLVCGPSRTIWPCGSTARMSGGGGERALDIPSVRRHWKIFAMKQLSDDPRSLSDARLAEILAGLKGQPGVKELADHIAALNDRLTVTNQYYEEFLIPEMERQSAEDAKSPWERLVRRPKRFMTGRET